MATIIRPVHSVYSPAGPAPSFDVEVPTGRLYDIELTSDPILFNGANARARAPRNFFSSFDGSGAIPPENSPATTSVFTYTLPAGMWGTLRRVPLLYYRLLSFAAGRRALETTLDDGDYDTAPFVLVQAGAARLNPMADITPVLDGVPAAGLPPAFDIRAGTQLFYGVELATDPQLFIPKNIYRRNHDNFFSSFLGMQDAPSEELETADGRARYTVPAVVWAHLRAAPHIYYRAITARSVQGLGAVYSLDEATLALAPAMTVGEIGPAAAEIDHRDARLLGRNPPPALCVRGDGNTNYEIELATSAPLLAGVAGRAPGVNYFSTSAGAAIGALVVPAVSLSLVNGVGTYVVPQAVWQSLGQAQFIFYRVTTFRLAAGVRSNIAMSPAPVGATHRMPGLWGGLPLDSSTAAVFVNALGEFVTGNFSSDHGPRSLPGAGRVWHPAIDVPVNAIPVYAVADGTIDLVNPGLGRVRVDHGPFKTSYLHMNVPFAAGVAMGLPVRRGQELGTANATAPVALPPHLHFELEHGGKNPLNRVRHTERAGPVGIAPGATLGPDFTPGSAATNGVDRFTVEMKFPTAGADAIAIFGFGVSTDTDKDLVSVDVRVLTEFAAAEADNQYHLDYSAVNAVPLGANQMLSANGTEGERTPRMVFDGSPRVAGLPLLTPNTRREFFIMPGPALAVALPQPFYAPLQAGANVGAQPGGRYDMYILPDFTDQGRPARDWFNYMWHVAPYTDDTGPHRLLVLATDLKGNSTALEEPFGIGLTGISGVTTPAGSAVLIPLRIQLLDNRAGNVELTISGTPGGWTAVGNWPMVAGVGTVALPAGGSLTRTLTVTPPAGAVLGDVADIKVIARSARLPAFRDSVTLRTTVGAAPSVPRILSNATSAFSLALPPFFRVETGADLQFAVEVSDVPDFYDGSGIRDEFNYFNSRLGMPGVAGVELQAPTGVAFYELPRLAWERCAALPRQRMYYRVLTAPDATWATIRRSPTSLLTIVPDWPTTGPAIEPLHALDPAFVIPPAFRVHVPRNFYYSVEVATDPGLFDNDVRHLNEHTFFSSWRGNSLIPPRPLTAPSGHAVYHVPEPVWGQMRQELISGRAVQLHYIVRQARHPAELFGTVHSSSLAHI